MLYVFKLPVYQAIRIYLLDCSWYQGVKNLSVSIYDIFCSSIRQTVTDYYGTTLEAIEITFFPNTVCIDFEQSIHSTVRPARAK